ncbi:MAG: diacylglycerol kinase family protein [Gaiellales bacterium]
MSAPTVFIVNPASGSGKTGRLWPELAERAAARGLRGDTLLTERSGHASSLAEQAAAGGAKVVVVVGGDGTVNEVVNGLRRAGSDDVELAILPRGTGDDFARMFGIPGDFDRALEIAATGRPRTIDIGRARYVSPEGSEEERYFVNFAGAGISGAIAKRGAATSRRLGARLAYFWATVAVFARWKSSEMSLEIDGERRVGQLYEVIVANGGYVAGGMWMAPEASPDDGLFEAVLIGDFTKAEFVATFPKIYRGTHVGHPKVEILRARTVSVDAKAPLPVVLDGEQPGKTPARFEIVPGAVRVRVPG